MSKLQRAASSLTTLIAALLAGQAAFAAEEPTPFVANLDLHRNEKLIGIATFTLSVTNGSYVMRTSMEGTKGVARFLGVEESSVSHGHWVDGAPRPDGFESSLKVSFKTIETTAAFDWEAGTLHSTHEDGESDFDLEAGVLDPVSVGLAIQAGLREGESEWKFQMIDEDEIETQHFKVAVQEQLETALGCLTTTRVDKIRGPQSTRYTQTWYADDYSFAPVFVAHGKKDGEHLESRLAKLTLNGESLPKGAPCP